MLASAEQLARRLFSLPHVARAAPLWADGGSDSHKVAFAPTRHYLAAFPDAMERVRVEDLAFGSLPRWLDDHVTARRAPRPLWGIALSYDAGRNLERLPATAVEDPVLPDVVLARYPAYLTAPSARGPWEIRAISDGARRDLERAIHREPGPLADAGIPTGVTSAMSPAAHRTALEDVLRGIRAGDLYQANVARRLEAACDPALAPALYLRMRASNPAAYGMLWVLDEDTWLASSSPECLLTFDGASRELHSYPIKGTRRRGDSEAQDTAMAYELLADPKDRAEHVMIVDLVRNDLGRVAVSGSVAVPTLYGLQVLPTVHHIVSDVSAVARPDVGLGDLVRALFPGGSVTGAPKIAAMARIERVEGLRRGFYTGSAGVLDGDGRLTLNILIRTCVLAAGRLLYQSGGGIVYDSDPDLEWRETEAKAAALLTALGR